jgi:DUF1365 family protein
MQAFWEAVISMYSAIYEGKVRHRRFGPVENAFEYRLFMMYLDLAELNQVFEKRWFWSVGRRNLAYLKRTDHFGDPAASIDCAVRRLIQKESGLVPTGPIRMLTHLRYLGHCFNPVSFFYCFDASHQRVETIVAEVHNTPWYERHCYVLTEALNDAADPWKHYRLRKDFHVSPFMNMDQQYDWRFLQPGERIQVHMQNFEEGTKLFDATLRLHRTHLTGRALARILVQYPAMTLQVVTKIYWQALKLRLKGATFYAHPSKRRPIRKEKK